MTYDELCATVGALRDRVADLEAKDAKTQTIESGLRIDISGVEGSQDIQGMVEAAMQRGLAKVPEINRQHRILFS